MAGILRLNDARIPIRCQMTGYVTLSNPVPSRRRPAFGGPPVRLWRIDPRLTAFTTVTCLPTSSLLLDLESPAGRRKGGCREGTQGWRPVSSDVRYGVRGTRTVFCRWPGSQIK